MDEAEVRTTKIEIDREKMEYINFSLQWIDNILEKSSFE